MSRGSWTELREGRRRVGYGVLSEDVMRGRWQISERMSRLNLREGVVRSWEGPAPSGPSPQDVGGAFLVRVHSSGRDGARPSPAGGRGARRVRGMGERPGRSQALPGGVRGEWGNRVGKGRFGGEFDERED